MSDRGKPQNFTERQAAVLLREVRAYEARQKRERGSFTQGDLAEALGVTQQTAGRMLRRDDVGFSYPTATRIAQLAEFPGVDDLFRAHGVFADEHAPEPDATVDPWPGRSGARSIAKLMGATDTAIARVVERCSDAFYRDRRQRWWVDEFLRETDAERDGQAHVRNHHPSTKPPSSAKKERRKAG